MGSLNGDFDELRKLINDVQELGNGSLRRATDAGREEVEVQYQKDFTSQRDPWGAGWAPTQRGNTPVLHQTGNLAGSTPTSTLGTIRMKPPKYWVFHQVGANGMPARAVLPFSSSLWDGPIQREIEIAVLGHLRKR